MAVCYRKRYSAPGHFRVDFQEITYPVQASPAPYQPPRKKQRLTQMTLDLGSSLQKTCKGCGMEYIPSNVQDSKLHTKFHAAAVGGVDVPRAFEANARIVQRFERKALNPGVSIRCASGKKPQSRAMDPAVVEVRRTDSPSAKGYAAQVLAVVQKELGALRIEDDELWNQVIISNGEIESSYGTPPQGTELTSKSCQADRHKVYLFLQDHKCLGFCLVERISQAHVVLPSTAASDPSLVTVSEELTSAILGVSRIWVSKEYRRANIARELLDCARASFLDGEIVEKSMIAFSQPTASGAMLARTWFNSDAGWLVYTEQ